MKILSKALFTANRSRNFCKLKTGALIWTLIITSPIPVLAGLDDLSSVTVETASAVPNPGFTRAFAPSEFAYPLCPTRNAGCLYVDANGTPISNTVFDELREFTDQGVAPVRVGDKWGYITKQGTWLFEPQFDEVPFGFYNGFASVRQGNKWGLISPFGEFVIDLISEKEITYAQGLALIEIGGKTGFMELTGNWVIAPTLYWALSFDQFGYAIARVKDGNNFGFKEGMIDRTGKWVVPPLYLDIENIQQNGLIRTRTFNGSWGVQNLQNNWAIQPKFKFISEFDANGQATIRRHDDQGRKFGIIDTKGRWIMRPKHYVTSGFAKNGLAAAQEGFLYGYVNKANEWVITPQLSSADKFADNGLAAVAIKRDDGVKKWGYINASGEWVIPPKYDFARAFNAFGLASVDIGPNYDDARRGLIDEQGRWVFEPILSIFHGYGSTGYASASIDGKFGLLDTAGNWAVPPMYDFTSVVGELVKIGFGEYQYEGYVTRDGEQLGDLTARLAAATTQAPGIETYQAKCDAGDANACVGLYRAHLAKIEAGNNRTPRGVKAIEALKLACTNKEAKLADACFTLARHLYLGDIVEQNTWDALVRFNRSCRYGSAEACVNVADGAMRRLSRFKDRESEKIGELSLRALERACFLENAEGCYKLGMFHKERKYLKSDPTKAATFLEQACNLAPTRHCK